MFVMFMFWDIKGVGNEIEAMEGTVQQWEISINPKDVVISGGIGSYKGGMYFSPSKVRLTEYRTKLLDAREAVRVAAEATLAEMGV